jgi:hypothetical protein
MVRMDRLHTQYQRLFLVKDRTALIDPDHRVRLMVLSLGRPADWATLSPLWRGVQVDLGLPAPAIAVNGVDGFELWFSLAEPVSAAEASRFLHGLQRRYLADLKPGRLRRWPDAAAPSERPAPHGAGLIPALFEASGQWSAFVAPDLAAVFGDEPSLDVEPGRDAQAEQLSKLASMAVADFHAALALLNPSAALALAVAPVAAERASERAPALNGPYQDPRRFLLDVMNDGAVPLVLRIDAAKALLASGG